MTDTDRPDTRAEAATAAWLEGAYGYGETGRYRDLVTAVAPALVGDHLRAIATDYRHRSTHPHAAAIADAFELAAWDADRHGEPLRVAGTGLVLLAPELADLQGRINQTVKAREDAASVSGLPNPFARKES